MDNNSTSVPELNIKVIILGLVLSVVMGSANVYLGLKAGMTVSASIPAAVVGMLALRAATCPVAASVPQATSPHATSPK